MRGSWYWTASDHLGLQGGEYWDSDVMRGTAADGFRDARPIAVLQMFSDEKLWKTLTEKDEDLNQRETCNVDWRMRCRVVRQACSNDGT